MNKIAFYYFGIFYWLYELGENSSAKWLSEWKAYVFQTIFEIWTLGAFYSYYFYNSNDPIKSEIDPSSLYLPFILFFGSKIYFLYERKDKWMTYVEFFRNLSKNERSKSKVITIFIIIGMVINIIFGYSLLF